jgi:hypothetical protein
MENDDVSCQQAASTVSELQISPLWVNGKYEYEAKVGSYLQLADRQDIGTKGEATIDSPYLSNCGEIAIRLAPSSLTT